MGIFYAVFMRNNLDIAVGYVLKCLVCQIRLNIEYEHFYNSSGQLVSQLVGRRLEVGGKLVRSRLGLGQD